MWLEPRSRILILPSEAFNDYADVGQAQTRFQKA